MNKILFSEREEIRPNTFLFPFTCSDAKSIRTDLRPHERSDSENKLLGIIHDRITLALLNRGFDVETVNFSSMRITAIDVKSIKENGK